MSFGGIGIDLAGQDFYNPTTRVVIRTLAGCTDSALWSLESIGRKATVGSMQVPRYSALVPESQPEWNAALTSPMWRQLLTRPMLAPGSAILVAGRRPLDTIDLLVDLAYDVTGWCEDPDAVVAGRRGHPLADFELWRPRHDPANERRFDLVFSVNASAHGENLYRTDVRMQTARLLACLKPAARLIILARHGNRGMHAVHCWLQHLGCFPGRITWEVLVDGGVWHRAQEMLKACLRKPPVERASPLSSQISSLERTPFRETGWMNWIRRMGLEAWEEGTVDDGRLAVTLQLPDEPLSLEDWEGYVRRGLFSDRRSCCQAVMSQQQGLVRAA